MIERFPVDATIPVIPAELLTPLITHFQPQRIILIGSAARGEAGPDSDVDLVVVLDDDAPPEKLGAKSVADARAGYHGAVDIIVCRASRLQSRARAIGSFAYLILRDGVNVYEQH